MERRCTRQQKRIVTKGTRQPAVHVHQTSMICRVDNIHELRYFLDQPNMNVHFIIHASNFEHYHTHHFSFSIAYQYSSSSPSRSGTSLPSISKPLTRISKSCQSTSSHRKFNMRNRTPHSVIICIRLVVLFVMGCWLSSMSKPSSHSAAECAEDG